jgi:hypothetical protein
MATLPHSIPSERREIPLSYDWTAEDRQQIETVRQIQEAARDKRHPLIIAGEALDQAAILFNRQSSRVPIVPSAFARAERRYLAAREAYFALLTTTTGQSEAELTRRVAA